MKFARLRHWLRNATRPRRPRPAPRPWRRALWLERLEDRLTPNAVSWTGNANDGNWETGQNWSTGSVPGPNDDVSINTFGTVNHSGADTVNSLTLAGGTLANSGSLTTGALTLDNTFATLNDTGSLTVNGPLNWTGGSLTGAGHTVLNGPSSLAGGFFSMLTDQVVDNHGTATISDGNSIDFRGNAVWNNDSDGTFVLQGSGSLGNFFITSSAAFNNFGTFQKTVGGTSTVGVPFNNSGSVDVQAGTLSPGNGGVGGGTFTVESGATLSVNGYTLNGATVTGAVQVGTFNSLTVAGPSSIENLTINGGTVTANAALSVQDLTLSGGSLTGPAAVTVSGAFNWTGGSLNGTGDTVLDGTSSLTGSFFSALARQVDNYGTATVVAGTSLSFQNNAVFNNQPGATLLLPDSAGMSTFFSGGSALNNAGLLEKTGPAGNSTLGLPVNNTGTIDVQAGTLTLSGGGSNSGSLTAESGATLSFTGPYTLQGGTVSGPGTFQVSGSASVTVSTPTSLPNLTVSGGSITADAALDVQSLTLSGGTVTANTGAITADSLALSGGTLTGPGTVTVNVAFNWTGGSLNGSGDTVLNGTSTLALANSFFSPLSRQVDNFGTATVAAGDSLTFENNVVFNNEAGATLVLPDSSSLSSFFSGGSALNNAGLVQKTAPAGTSTIGIAFNNTGSVDVQAGTLALTGGGVGGSTFTVEGGATLSTNGYTLNGATVTGDGALQVGIFNSLTVAGPSSIENLTLSGGTVTANAALAVQNLTLSGGSLTGPAAVTLSGAFNWTGGGSLTGTGDTVLDGPSTINGSFFAPLERQVDNYGTATVLAGSTLYFENNGVWNNQPTGVFVLPDSAGVSNFFAANPVFNNAGLIRKAAPANTSSFGLTVNNTGTIEVDAGTLSLAGLTNLSGTTLSGGTYLLTGVLQVPSADVHTLAATVVLNGPGSELFNSAFFSQNDAFTNLGANAAGGSLTLENGRALTTPGDFANAGAVAVGAGSAFTATGNYTQSGGSTSVDGTLTANTTVTVNGGVLSGGGTVNANVVNAALVSPGDSPGVLTVIGNYTQTAAGALNVEIGGPVPGTGYDQLAITGSATLAGSFNIVMLNNYVPDYGTTFHVLRFAGHGGDFDPYNGQNIGNGRYLYQQFAAGDSGLDLLTVHLNHPPVLAPILDQTVNEGSLLTFTASATDPDAGQTLTFTLDPGAPAGARIDPNTGVFTYTPPDGPASYQVTVRVTDDGLPPLSDTQTFTINVLPVPPTAALSWPADGVRGQARTFTLVATEPSLADQAAGFTYQITWGDGSSQAAAGPSGLQLDHVYTASGTYTVQLTATDTDGAASAVASQAVTITAVELQGTTLVAGGTTGDDVIRFGQRPGGAINVTINGVSQGDFTGVTGIVAYGQAGNDVLSVSGRVTVPAALFGGDGNDVLQAGGGPTVLVGGAGDNVLLAGSGRDVLIGGSGTNVLLGLGGDDLLIAGSTAFDSNVTALQAILAEWSSGRDYLTRIANLTGTGSGADFANRLNGDNFLVAGQTVFGDAGNSLVVGGPGQDWFFAGLADLVLGRRNDEVLTQL